MDIFISNVPPRANKTELKIFLRDIVQRYDILAFEVFKLAKTNWAILTAADPDNAQRFLQTCGGVNPLNPLYFKQTQIRFRKSNKPGQPDLLKVRALKDKEFEMRAKRHKQHSTSMTYSSKPLFPFTNMQIGVWSYTSPQKLAFGSEQEKLTFDSKHRDLREGTITCGRSALVVYLAAGKQDPYSWHCRIDVPYSIIEHAIPSDDSSGRGTLTLTLKSPPKIYRIEDTDDLHLYTGTQPMDDSLEQALRALSMQATPKEFRKQRLVRETSILPGLNRNSALCMVYRFVLLNSDSAQRAWSHISRMSALSRSQAWNSMIPLRNTLPIEREFDIMAKELERYDRTNGLSMLLDFAVRFQLLALVLEGTLSPARILELIPHVQIVCKHYGPELVARGVRKLQYQIPTPGPDVTAEEFGSGTIVATLAKNIREFEKIEGTTHDLVAKQKKHEHLVMTYKATVTPTGLLLRGPDATVSNRVLRKYADKSEYFLRVFFADEDGMSVLHDPRASQEKVYARFREFLLQGVQIAGRTYTFLGFSHSSLRNHTAWFMAPFVHEGTLICSKDVIEDLGDFSHIHCSAKCAARIGQAFSDTVHAIHIADDVFAIETYPDVERNGRCFSDGCGRISLKLLEEIWLNLPPERRKLRPTVLQIRYRGAKGVVSLDTSLPDKQLILRKSMTKYTAKESWRDLELCGAAYKPLVMYLNHQFVKIIEDLGVTEQNFVAVQQDALEALEMIVQHPINAASFLEYSHSGVCAKIPTLFTLMHEIGLSFQTDRFLTDVVEVAAMSSLRDMKYRARIPVERGYLLYGIMDETNELREDEVYIATARPDDSGHWRRKLLLGDRILVTRAPALHPGDVQMRKAVDVSKDSPLRQLYNCIVFSQQGQRDLPSQLSGGDLDGDLFHIIFDERLIPPITHEAADYPPTEALDLGRPVEVYDIVDFFVNYMSSDRLGQISNKHKIRADLHREGTLHPDCQILAELASDAVDFSKSGKPVDMSKVPRGADHYRPDFMQTGPGLVLNEKDAMELVEDALNDVDDPDALDVLDPERFSIRYYKSHKVLGVLYRRIDEADFFSRMKGSHRAIQDKWGDASLIGKLEQYVDRETSLVQWEQHRGFAEELRESYEENMFEIMDSLRPHRGKRLSELEVFSGNILGKKERASTRHIREANLEVQERFNRDVSSFVRRIVTGYDSEEDEGEALPRAIACFKTSLETKGWEDYAGLKSWKYVAAGVCLEQLWRYMHFRLRPF